MIALDIAALQEIHTMAMPTKSPAERYLEHLHAIFHVEPTFHEMEKLDPDLPAVTALVYEDVPEPGFVTGITYGLSLVDHPEWNLGRTELCITVESGEAAWALVAAFVANNMRGDCPFTYGSTINFHNQIHPESEMSAFFVFAPSILKNEQYANIEVGTDYKVNIAGLYPIYEEEIGAIAAMGLKDFWHDDNFDPFDFRRKKVTG